MGNCQGLARGCSLVLHLRTVARAERSAIACPVVISLPAAISIAIVDDDEIHCRSLSRLVRRAGFHAVIFNSDSAEDFLVAPERASFRCLLLDIELGGISGIALHRRLLAQGDRTPVVYITGHDDPAARAEGMHTGAAGFLRKTDPSSALIEVLRRVTSAP